MVVPSRLERNLRDSRRPTYLGPVREVQLVFGEGLANERGAKDCASFVLASVVVYLDVIAVALLQDSSAWNSLPQRVGECGSLTS